MTVEQAQFEVTGAIQGAAIAHWQVADDMLSGRAVTSDEAGEVFAEFKALGMGESWATVIRDFGQSRGTELESGDQWGTVTVETPAGMVERGGSDSTTWGYQWNVFLDGFGLGKLNDGQGVMGNVADGYGYANREAKRAMGMDPNKGWAEQLIPSWPSWLLPVGIGTAVVVGGAVVYRIARGGGR